MLGMRLETPAGPFRPAASQDERATPYSPGLRSGDQGREDDRPGTPAREEEEAKEGEAIENKLDPNCPGGAVLLCTLYIFLLSFSL